MSSNSHAAGEQHPGLHHRTHAGTGVVELSENVDGAQQQHNSSSSHPADVEAAISPAGNDKAPDGPKDVSNQELQLSEKEEQYADVTYGDIAKQFFILGWTAFGGPAAHIGLFQRRLVEKLNWMSSEVYAELFALCQCMPGPASTQLSFAIGVVKKNVRGGLMSGALFQYPGAFIMTAVGVFAGNLLANPSGILNGVASGVSAVGVALVASAAKGMAGKLCATPITGIISTGAVVGAYYWPKPYTFPVLIALGGLITTVWSYYKKETLPPVKTYDSSVRSHGLNIWTGSALLAVWVIVLIVTVVLGTSLASPPPPLQWWQVFYRTGSIIYGGGQVVLPMLYHDVVQQTCDPVTAVCVDNADTWVTSKQFYAGLGVVQALPGPLFNFSAYLGAIIAMNAGYNFLVGAVLAWFGLFAPGVMIIFGVLPIWGKVRNWGLYRRAMPGLNAAGVGLIIASVFSLALGALGVSDFKVTSLCIGVIAFTAVDQLKWFEPGVVLAGGVMGIIAWAAGML